MRKLLFAAATFYVILALILLALAYLSLADARAGLASTYILGAAINAGAGYYFVKLARHAPNPK